MQLVDSIAREAVIIESGNIVISASAGTGKTHTTIERIKSDKQYNYQYFAAITFTRKAAKEIRIRLGNDLGRGFVGTNDNFILSEIIQPFMFDVYGDICKEGLSPDYSDENQVSSFEEGIEKAKAYKKICKFNDNRINFSFMLALDILKKSEAARMYLISKYYRIYIDEYQDSDRNMHEFFMYISDELGIPLFVVGDEKQSIYGWRGAYKEGFISLFNKEGFKYFKLIHNFRSVKQIQNYANIFLPSVRDNVELTDFNDEVQIARFNTDDEACIYISKWIDRSKNCTFLNFSNDNAKKWAEHLNENGLDFKYIKASPLDNSNLESEHIWIARVIAKYFYDKSYSEYDFLDEAITPEKYKANKIKDLLDKIVESVGEKNIYKDNVLEIYKYIGYTEDITKIEVEIETLYEVLNDNIYRTTYERRKYMQTCGTIHSSKGLEFKQVIVCGYDYSFRNDENRFLHYVAVTRPEERLLVILNNTQYSNMYLQEVTKCIGITKEINMQIDNENIFSIVN
ncbi:MAG: ATP-dependent helicase [Peptostreptococcaceae bacterium]